MGQVKGGGLTMLDFIMLSNSNTVSCPSLCLVIVINQSSVSQYQTIIINIGQPSMPGPGYYKSCLGLTSVLPYILPYNLKMNEQGEL